MTKQKLSAQVSMATYSGLSALLAPSQIRVPAILANKHGKKKIFSTRMLKILKHYSQLSV